MCEGLRNLRQALGKNDHSGQRLLCRIEQVRNAGHRTHDALVWLLCRLAFRG